jgi:hypothetical protein
VLALLQLLTALAQLGPTSRCRLGPVMGANRTFASPALPTTIVRAPTALCRLTISPFGLKPCPLATTRNIPNWVAVSLG